MTRIKLICFDLDDTLWPCLPTIQKAEEAYYLWFVQNHPIIAEQYSTEQLREKRLQLRARKPELQHDMTLLRIHSLVELAEEHGMDHLHGKGDWIEEAFQAFYQARQQVKFYEDVEPVLARLKSNYHIAAATNGNADIYQTELARYFDYSVSASEAGYMKPDPAMFELLQQKSGFSADEILHIGDHPQDDIEGARRAGITNVWLNRLQKDWSNEHLLPDYVVEDLHQIIDLLGLD